MTSAHVDGIEVLWRPGCPFCMKLRASLKLRGISTTEVNIWSEPDAAARVREATGGDETVPTVFVGTRSLVNPSVGQIVAAVEQELPHRVDELVGTGGGWWSRITGSSRSN